MPGRDAPSARVVTVQRRAPRPDAEPAPATGRAPAGRARYRPGPTVRAVRGFVRRYGWRAYALPLLVAVTAAALFTMHDPIAPAGPEPSAASPLPAPRQTAPAASGDTMLKSDGPSGGAGRAPLAPQALPSGAAYTKAGTGTFRVLKGTTTPFGHGPLHRYDIEVENGISGIDLAGFARLVDQTLADPRSWSGHGVSLQRVDSGPVDFHISLTSAMTVRTLCGYEIHVETSCYVPAGGASDVNRVVIDDARWVRGATAYLGDLTAYRQYLINHEDGHALGHEHAHECLPGGLAPAMMQQTIGLRDAKTGTMCQANPWPYPPGVKGAPGTEAPDTSQNSEFGLVGD